MCRPSETVSVKMARTWFHETVRTPTKKFKLRRLSQPHRHLKGGALIKAFQFKRSLMGRFLLEEQLHLHPSPCPAHSGPDREVRFAGLLYWVKTGVHLRHIRIFTGCAAENLLVTVNHQQLGSP